MLRRHVLSALAAGITAGDDDAARAALKKIDLVLRRPARKKLERALIDAALMTNEFAGADAESTRHVQRVAALQIAGKLPADVVDRARVAAAYDALPPARAGGAPIATILACGLGAAIVALCAAFVMTRPGPAPRSYARELPPPAAGAFKDGGVPLADPALEKVFVGPLTSLVIESDRDRQSGGMDKDRGAHSVALIAAPEVYGHGPALTKAWGDMLHMLDRWVSVPVSSREFKDIVREFRSKVRAVSDQMAAAGVGYYLEGDVYTQGDAAHALVYAYKVEQVVFVQAGGQPRRVLNLRRLDKLNISHALLGMQSQDLGDPVLLLDQIDDHVASHLFPVLAPDAPWELADDAYQARDGAALAAAAGKAVRAELLAQLGPDADAAQQIGRLLGRRAQMIEAWRKSLEGRGWVMPSTDHLFLPEQLLASLDGVVQDSQIDQVREMEDQIAKLGAPRIAARLQQLLEQTVRRHEAQHGIDADRGDPQRYPEPLEDLLGAATGDDGEPRRSVESARAELSAYTSQLANDPFTPRLSLWNVARFAFDDNQAGSSESYAGVLIVEGLARHLGISSPGPVIHDRMIDRARLLALATPMAAKSGDELRAAARALWHDLYGEDLVPITDR